MAQKALMAYDQLDILTFVQTTSRATVEAFDAEADDIAATIGIDTDVLDLGAASPNYQNQSAIINQKVWLLQQNWRKNQWFY